MSDTITLIMDRKDADGLYNYIKRELPGQIESDYYEPDKEIEYQHSFLRAVFVANCKEQEKDIEEENYKRFCDELANEEEEEDE